MLYQIFSYLKFLLFSINQHGIHSPFVYKLTTDCFYRNDKNIADLFLKFKDYQKSLLNNNQSIHVTDFGAGSKVFKSNLREVSAIAKNAGITNKKAKLLLKIVQYFKPHNILEIGTSLGLGTSCLSIGNTDAKIITLEGCPQTAKIAQKQFDDFNLQNIKIKVGDFKNTLHQVTQGLQYDLIYFDGNHTKEATLQYFNQCLPTTHNNSIFIFDDIHWSKDMEEAWNLIKDHEAITVSIDVFYWGIIFFRNEQPKQHFNIRV
ncbi:MAG: class I SAM-dependent methyltransferase [Bacteroidota bacterium]